VEPNAVARPRPESGATPGVNAVVKRRQRPPPSRRAPDDLDFDPPRLWRPHAELDAVAIDVGAERWRPSHDVSVSSGSARRMVSRMAWVNSSGRATFVRCAAPGSSRNCDPGTYSWIFSATSGVVEGSSEPTRTSVATPML